MYREIMDSNDAHLLVDVREKLQFDICNLSHSVHISLEALPKQIDLVAQRAANLAQRLNLDPNDIPSKILI
jgi:adenylyltransferase/sulfurtransferase